MLAQVEGVVVGGVFFEGGYHRQVRDEELGAAGAVKLQRLGPGIEMAVAVLVHPIGDGHQQLEHLVVVAGAGGGVFQEAVVFKLGQVAVQ